MGLSASCWTDRADRGPVLESGRKLPSPALLFPAVGLSPCSPCPHEGDVRPGSNDCCMVCYQYGMDHHPAMRETAKEALRLKNWKPPEDGDQWAEEEVRETAEPTKYEGKAKTKTRKQRRAEERAAKSPD